MKYKLPLLTENIFDMACKSESVTNKIKTISEQLLDLPYCQNPLTPYGQDEEFIYSLTSFDCVTFLETVLALALAKKSNEVEKILKKIRYHDAQVSWQMRCHYMTNWIEENEKNGFLKLDLDFSNASISRHLSALDGYPEKNELIHYRPIEFIQSPFEKIKDGALLFFVSMKDCLDYFHVGIAIRDDDDTLYLRHAAKSIGCVNDEPFEHFLARNEMLGITQAIVI